MYLLRARLNDVIDDILIATKEYSNTLPDLSKNAKNIVVVSFQCYNQTIRYFTFTRKYYKIFHNTKLGHSILEVLSKVLRLFPQFEQ